MAKKTVKNKKPSKKKTTKKSSSRSVKTSVKKPAKKVVKKPTKKTLKKPVKKAPPKKPTQTKKKTTVVRKKSSPANKPAVVRKKPSPKKKPTTVRKKSSPPKKKPVKRTTKRPTKKPVAKKSSQNRRPAARAQKRSTKTFIRIKVIGVGGGGGNAITRMRRNFSVRGVEFLAINTDIQDLESCDAHRKLHIGRVLTKGMGAGMNPDLGQQAAEENRSEIIEMIKDSEMVFITSGFGGGTGTGAAPVIAEIARDLGILTVAVITKPFSFEGSKRAKIAEDGISRIKDKVDTLLVIPNDRIFTIIDKNTSVLKAFERIDDILRSAVQGVAEVISASGLVNVDFADIKAVTSGVGSAVIGVGSASGADRAVKAINQAIHSPLLDISIDGAQNVLFGIAGGRDLRMSEINEAAKIITDTVDPGAKIIFGAYYDRKLKQGTIKITLIATGFSGMMFKRDSDSLTLFEDDIDSIGDIPEITNSPDSESEGGTSQRTFEEEEETTEDILDTPTFLRKRGKRK